MIGFVSFDGLSIYFAWYLYLLSLCQLLGWERAVAIDGADLQR